MDKGILESFKEGLRIAFFAGVSALVAWGTTKLSSLDPSSAYVVVGTIVLRLVDKFIHNNDNISAGGISPV